MLTRKHKEQIVQDAASSLRAKPSALFVDYGGVDTASLRKLRLKLREAGGTLRVIRKTLFRRALVEAGVTASPPEDIFAGQLGVVSGFSDPVSAAKVIVNFRKELEAAKGPDIAFALRGGLLDGRFVTFEEAQKLATIPTRDELHARIIDSLAAPLRGLLAVLSGPQRGLVQVLKARAETMQ